MVEVIQFFSDYAILIYFILFIALLFSLRRYSISRREQNEAVFGLELDLARRRSGKATIAILSICLLALGEFFLLIFLVPSLPGIMIISTPSRDQGLQLSSAIPEDTIDSLDEVISPGASAKLTSSCIPGQIMITSPKPGDQIRGTISLIGTADIPNFGFYKYEFSPANAQVWTTIQAGRDPKHDTELGSWNTSELSTGDYLLRLVVSDNKGLEFPACIVQIRVLQP